MDNLLDVTINLKTNEHYPLREPDKNSLYINFQQEFQLHNASQTNYEKDRFDLVCNFFALKKIMNYLVQNMGNVIAVQYDEYTNIKELLTCPIK